MGMAKEGLYSVAINDFGSWIVARQRAHNTPQTGFVGPPKETDDGRDHAAWQHLAGRKSVHAT